MSQSSSPAAAVRTRTALTLAAGAAAAVTAQQAGAAVIYTPINAPVDATHTVVSIDFNHDITSEAGVTYNSTTGLAANKQSGFFPSYGNGTDINLVKALSAGDTIDANLAYSGLSSSSAPTNGIINDGAGHGEFTVAAGERYIAINFGFGVSDGPYFGWVGFRVDNDSSLENLSGTVTGYAYQNSVGQPIAAGEVPEPSSLGLLAMGATGLAAYRRRTR